MNLIETNNYYIYELIEQFVLTEIDEYLNNYDMPQTVSESFILNNSNVILDELEDFLLSDNIQKNLISDVLCESKFDDYMIKPRETKEQYDRRIKKLFRKQAKERYKESMKDFENDPEMVKLKADSKKSTEDLAKTRLRINKEKNRIAELKKKNEEEIKRLDKEVEQNIKESQKRTDKAIEDNKLRKSKNTKVLKIAAAVIGITTAIIIAYKLFKKYKYGKCSNLEGPAKYRCLTRGCDEAIRSIEMNMRKCKDSKCIQSYKKELNKWKDKRDRYKDLVTREI